MEDGRSDILFQKDTSSSERMYWMFKWYLYWLLYSKTFNSTVYTKAMERSAMDGGVMARSFSTWPTLANPKRLLLVKVMSTNSSVNNGTMTGGETQVLERIEEGGSIHGTPYCGLSIDCNFCFWSHHYVSMKSVGPWVGGMMKPSIFWMLRL